MPYIFLHKIFWSLVPTDHPGAEKYRSSFQPAIIITKIFVPFLSEFARTIQWWFTKKDNDNSQIIIFLQRKCNCNSTSKIYGKCSYSNAISCRKYCIIYKVTCKICEADYIGINTHVISIFCSTEIGAYR